MSDVDICQAFFFDTKITKTLRNCAKIYTACIYTSLFLSKIKYYILFCPKRFKTEFDPSSG